MATSKHTPYFECLEALQAGDCPACASSRRTVSRYLASVIYESVNDPGIRERTRASHGFCRLHAWQLRRQGGALGIAIIYRDVVRDAVETLGSAEYNRSGRLSTRAFAEAVDKERPSAATAATAAALQPTGECPACAVQRRTESMYVGVLLDHLEDDAIQAALAQGGGLCLPHLRLAVQRVRSEGAYRRLVAVAEAQYSALLRDLDEMIRLHDYRFQDQGLDEVGDAWLRAIARVAGEEGLS